MSGRRLNHQGFSAFLQNKSGGGVKKSAGSSTKEIARKAVEDEWERNQKRQRSGYGGDSSDEEDDDQQNRRKHQRMNEEEEEDDIFEFSQDYRDRAQERREGSNPIDPLLPLPSKGLDLKLARKLRKELKEGGGGEKGNDGPRVYTELPTMEQANGTLASIVSKDDNATGSSSMIDSTTAEYIRELLKLRNEVSQSPTAAISCTLAGKKIQRSRLVVVVNASITDLKRSWEIPREVTNSNPSSNGAQQCLGLTMIQKIEAILKPMKKYPAASFSNAKRADLLEARDTKEARKTSSSSLTKKHDKGVDEDDDDDIFGGLDDYVPPGPKAKQ